MQWPAPGKSFVGLDCRDWHRLRGMDDTGEMSS
jgi:hypothetical protein